MDRKIKEIILFCYGDSTKASTWSNVPYLMSKALEEKGVRVHRVNIAPNSLVNKIYRHTISRLHGAFYSWNRTKIFKKITEYRIRKAVKRYAGADFCIFLNFDFYNRFSAIPSLLFSDWTYEILLRDRKHVAPGKRELEFMRRQRDAINTAEIVIPLFQESVEKMRESYPEANILDLECNVVNNMNREPRSEAEVLDLKAQSGYVLFVGKPAYRSGLVKLIESMKHVEPEMKLHVIGMTKNDVDVQCGDNVIFHGYLKKDVEAQNRMYYNLLEGAKLIVNPQSEWGAYSSIVEGMFHYCPVVVAPFVQFEMEFGKDIDFGRYVLADDSRELGRVVAAIANAPENEYRAMCLNAHQRVAGYTWSNFVDKMIAAMNSNL